MNKADLVNEVANVGFGSFKVVQRKARTGSNPQTGAEIQISASNAPKFLPAKLSRKQ